MRSIFLFLMLCVLGIGTAHAQSGKRVALLIGNANYASASVLANPRNDVRLVAESAKKAGFQTVTIRQDVSVAQFRKALSEFRGLANGAEVAMVYYAGHGMEGNGKNWLIPVDAALNDDRDLPDEAIELNRVMDDIAGANLRMVVLDACRNNPFGRSWRAGSRAVSRGLAEVDADNVLVIYAAAPGQVAQDGEGGNSPFAKALAKRITEPGLSVHRLGGAIRDDVLASTGNTQRPFVSASISGNEFYFVQVNNVVINTAPATASVAAHAVVAPASVDPVALDLAMWQGALAANTVASYEDYLSRNPNGQFRVQAEQVINRMGGTAVASVSMGPLTKLAIKVGENLDNRQFGDGACQFTRTQSSALATSIRNQIQRVNPDVVWTAETEADAVIDIVPIRTDFLPAGGTRVYGLEMSVQAIMRRRGGTNAIARPLSGRSVFSYPWSLSCRSWDSHITDQLGIVTDQVAVMFALVFAEAR